MWRHFQAGVANKVGWTHGGNYANSNSVVVVRVLGPGQDASGQFGQDHGSCSARAGR